MLAPGSKIASNGRVYVAVGSGIVPNFINQGFGFMSDGRLAIDTAAPSGNNYNQGFRISPAGAVYGTSTASS